MPRAAGFGDAGSSSANGLKSDETAGLFDTLAATERPLRDPLAADASSTYGSVMSSWENRATTCADGFELSDGPPSRTFGPKTGFGKSAFDATDDRADGMPLNR